MSKNDVIYISLKQVKHKEPETVMPLNTIQQYSVISFLQTGTNEM